MRLMNMMPHDLVLFLPNRTIRIPSSGVIRAREEVHPETIQLPVELEDGTTVVVPAFRVSLGAPVVSMPDGTTMSVPDLLKKYPDCVFVVSRIAADAIRTYYPDLAPRFYAPYDIVKDEKGNVVGAKALACA